MKNKKIKLIGIIIIIVITLVIGWNVYDKAKIKKSLIEDSEYWLKVGQWFKAEDAVNDVKKLFQYMIELTDKTDESYEFYRKYLSQNEIKTIIKNGYTSLDENFDISYTETEKLLELFITEKNEDEFKEYMKYLGEKAYYEKENSDCKSYISASIYNDHVLVKERNFIEKDDMFGKMTYTLVLRDKNLRILYFLEKETTVNIYNYDEDKEIRLDVKDVNNYDYYFKRCSST